MSGSSETEMTTFAWSGASSTTRRDFSHLVPALAALDDRLERTQLFRWHARELSAMSAPAREARAKAWLDGLDDAKPVLPVLGLTGTAAHDRFTEETRRAFRAVVRLCVANLEDRLESFLAFVVSRQPEEARRFRSVLDTSLLDHVARSPARTHLVAALAARPQLLTGGIDCMIGPNGPVLAEFQFAGQIYPHYLGRMRQVIEQLEPALFSRLEIAPDPFPGAFVELVRRHAAGERAVVIDAWAPLAHPHVALRPLAQALGAEYQMFDALLRARGLDALLAGQRSAFVYNQPLCSMLDPDDPVFARLTAEGMESYPDLGAPGIFARHVTGEVRLANPPFAELSNDKALYALLPLASEFFLEEQLSLPVSTPIPLWNLDDPTRPDGEALARLRRDQEGSVVVHRYVEGGLGIRIGRDMSEADWSTLLAHVTARPDRFVARDYLPMDPPMSTRTLFAASVHGGRSEPIVELQASNDQVGRINLAGGLDNVSEGGWVFLVCRAGAAIE